MLVTGAGDSGSDRITILSLSLTGVTQNLLYQAQDNSSPYLSRQFTLETAAIQNR